MSDPVMLNCYTDPICPWSWAFEPVLRRIEVEFGSQILLRPVMGGLNLTRTEPPDDGGVRGIQAMWRKVAEATGQAIDWQRAAVVRPRSSRPLCESVAAACLQGEAVGGHYLRRMREAYFLAGVDPYTVDDRLELAKQTPGLDVARWTGDLQSGSAAGLMAKHFAEARNPLPGAPIDDDDDEERRYGFPTLVWRDPRSEIHRFFTSDDPMDALRAALQEGGLTPSPLPSVTDALLIYPTLTQAELAAVCGLEPASIEEAVAALGSGVSVTDVHGKAVYRTGT